MDREKERIEPDPRHRKLEDFEDRIWRHVQKLADRQPWEIPG
jgi:hypothetical protein